MNHIPGLIHMTHQIVLIGLMQIKDGKRNEGIIMIEDAMKTLNDVVQKMRADEIVDRYADFPDPTDIEEMRVS